MLKHVPTSTAAVLDVISDLYPIPNGLLINAQSCICLKNDSRYFTRCYKIPATRSDPQDGSSTARGASIISACTVRAIGNTYLTTGKVLKNASDANMTTG